MLLGELGRGGMGVVYKARQIGLNRFVALKTLLAGGHASLSDLARFLREAEVIARLRHPNIVQVYEVGECGGLPYFSLEFCPGGSLAAKLAGTPLPPRKAAELVGIVAKAVHTAHTHDIVHRDLKPGNILLDEDGTPKVTDFGLAKKLDSGDGPTRTGAIMGTPSHMAPEQASEGAKSVGRAADVYALGAILYELLTGRPPFRAATNLQTLHQVIHDDPVPPGRLQPGLPRDLETIALKCLQKEPARRYASAQALADDLARFRAGEPIVARPVGLPERAWRWARRNPRAAALAAAWVVGVAGSLAGMTALWRQAVEQRRLADAHATTANRAREQADQARQTAEASAAVARAQQAAAEVAGAKARRTAQFLAGIFEGADPLGLNGYKVPIPRGGGGMTLRDVLVRGAERIRAELREDAEVRADLMDRIASALQTLGQYDAAEPLLTDALGLRRAALGDDHPDVAESLHHLAWLKHERGQFPAAEGLYRDILDRLGRQPKPDELKIAAVEFSLCFLLAQIEDFAAAEVAFGRALERRVRLLGPDHRETAISRFGLAALELKRGNAFQAIPHVLAAARQLINTDATTDPTLAKAVDLFQTAVIAQFWGSPAKAEPLFTECLRLGRGGPMARLVDWVGFPPGGRDPEAPSLELDH
jgi:tetratricopeptide (TPR) repeat protein